MYEHREKNGKAIECYRVNEDDSKTKVVISVVRRKKNAIVIMATEQKDSKKPKITINSIAICKGEPLIFTDLVKAEDIKNDSKD